MKAWLVIINDGYGGGAYAWYVFATRGLAEAFADEYPWPGGVEREDIEVEEHEVRTSLEEF